VYKDRNIVGLVHWYMYTIFILNPQKWCTGEYCANFVMFILFSFQNKGAICFAQARVFLSLWAKEL